MDAYDIDNVDGSIGAAESLNKWAVFAVILSILLHIALLFWAGNRIVQNFGEAYYEQIVPRKFKLERVEIDPALLEEETPRPEPAVNHQPIPLDLPDEKMDKPTTAPAKADTVRPKEFDLDTLEAASPLKSMPAAALDTVDAASGSNLEQDLKSLREQLTTDTAASSSQPALVLPAEAVDGGGNSLAERAASMPGYSNLDNLLSKTGPLQESTAPILLPSDLLFDYDASVLQTAAEASLKKLAVLIQRNPDATFVIEGHTDTFGSDEYNLNLSKQRAQSVRDRLVNSFGIPAEHLQTAGYGSQRVIANANGSIEEQQMNRRVEIVIILPEASIPRATQP
ncbi:MAG: OmpA family protein [Chthoniobacterales bacterium]